MPDDLRRWLVEIGLGGHADAFASQGIDWDVLPDLSEQDLKELGLPLGDRKRLLKALATLDGVAHAGVAHEAHREHEHHREHAHAAQHPRQHAHHRASAHTGTPHEAERRQLTVMFVDLIDSTPLTTRFDPEDMRRLLGVFHQTCARAIEAHGGHIAQYIGDGLLVYFGYPHAHEDDANRAALAALAIVSLIRQENDGIEARDGVRFHVRIGIETGLVVAGEVGAGASLDHWAVVGETPVIAARLQAIAPADTVVIGPATEHLVQGYFALEDLGLRELKGVSEPIRVYRVLRKTRAADRFEIRITHGVKRIVGRTAELDMLRHRWAQSVEGEMRCVLLLGEPGIGKSRMLRAFRDSVANDPHEVMAFHCASYDCDSPFWPILQCLQRYFEVDSTSTDVPAMAHIESRLSALGVDIDDAVPVLGTLFGIAPSDVAAQIDASSPSFKRRTLDVLVAIVEKIAQRLPLLVIVEDAHWIDPSSLEFVKLMLERLVSSRLLVVLTGRREFKPEWAYPQMVQINLDRLSRRDCARVIEQLTGGKALPPMVFEHIIAKTDGVPLFVEELTKTVLQSDLLRDAGARYEFVGTPQMIAIPDTLQGSLLSRLDRLEPQVKETAQIASTIGREFGARLLGLISSKSEAALQPMLDRLAAAEIILPARGSLRESDTYVFRHALIQDIAYQSLLLARRRHYHALIAQALEHHYPEIAERQPELVAQNFAAAGLAERGIGYWQRASERALANAAYEEAIAHAQRGLHLVEDLDAQDGDRSIFIVPLLLARGGAEHRLGRRDAIQTFRDAAQLARQNKHSSFLVQAALGFDTAETFLEGTGKLSIALIEETLASICPGETVDRCRLLSRLARTLHMTGSFARGGEVVGEAIAIARRLDDRSSLFDALACEVMAVGSRDLPASEFASRRCVLQELRDIAEQLADLHSIGHACARGLSGFLEIGERVEFEAALSRYEEVASSGKHMIDKWCVTGALAMKAILDGDFSHAEHKAEASLKFAEDADAHFAIGVYGMQMFTIRREQSRLAEVAPVLKRFVDEHPEDAAWRPGLMLISSDLGFVSQARRALAQLSESETSIPIDSKRLITLTYLAEVAARLNDVKQAERIYALLFPFREQVVTVPVFTLCCGAVARYLGMLARVLGDWDSAESHFEYALQMDERLRATPWLAHTRHEYAVMLAQRNRSDDPQRATALLDASLATAKNLGMLALSNDIAAAAGGART